MQLPQLFLYLNRFCKQAHNIGDMVEIVNVHHSAFMRLKPLIKHLVATNAVIPNIIGYVD